MAKKFNLAEYVKDDMSKMDTGAEQITLLPLEKLIPDERNFYSLDGIEELAANIETVGLLDPIRVRPQDGEYVIVSGHRRRAACMLIRDGGNPMFDRGVPCIIELGEASDAMRELRLIFANSATRVMSSADLSKQAERTAAVFAELKAQGVEFNGRIRTLVAEVLRVSESKIARGHAIRANLVPVLLEKFDNGQLNESAAYRLSQEDQGTQYEVWRSVGISISGVSAESVGAIIDQVKKKKAQPADPAPAPESPYRGREEVERYLAERAEEDADFREMLCATAGEFFDRLTGVCTRQDGIALLKQNFGACHAGWWNGGPDVICSPKGVELSGDGHCISRTWTDVYDMLCTIALNGENVKGGPPRASAPTWETGTPEEPGWYACWAVWVDKYKGALAAYDPDYETLYWNGTIWTNGLNSTKDAGFTVHYWYRLPDEPNAVSEE